MDIIKITERVIKEGKVIKVQNPNVEVISMIDIIKNPLKSQAEKLLDEDRFHILRGFLTDDDLYCWRSYCLTHQEAINALLKEEGIVVEPICGIVFNKEAIQIANSWNSIKISEENKEKILHHQGLEYLFGEGYKIIGINDNENR